MVADRPRSASPGTGRRACYETPHTPEEQLRRRGVVVCCLAAALVLADVGGTLISLDAAANFDTVRVWQSVTGHKHLPPPAAGTGADYHEPPWPNGTKKKKKKKKKNKKKKKYDHDTTHQQEVFDASVVELCALLMLRLACGAATAAFYWPRSFLRRPRAADGLFSVRFFCEAAFMLCTVACALKTGLTVYATWFEHGHGRGHHHGADGSGSGSWSGPDDDGDLELDVDGDDANAMQLLVAQLHMSGSGSRSRRALQEGLSPDEPVGPTGPRPESVRFDHLQGIWVTFASVVGTVCSLLYVLLCRFVGNRNWRDPKLPPDPSWLKEQQRVFGWRFLLFIALVNLMYGITTSWFLYFNTYYLSKGLELTPSQLSEVGGTINLCIIVRPLLGFLSDSVPIYGSTRTAYFFIAATGSAGCYLALAILEPLVDISVNSAVALLCVANILGYAWCGVLLYAIVATEQRREPLNGAAQLNAIQWGFYSGGSLLGDLSEGIVLEAITKPHNGYWLCAVCWLIMAVCGFLYQEGRPISIPIDQLTDQEGSDLETPTTNAFNARTPTQQHHDGENDQWDEHHQHHHHHHHHQHQHHHHQQQQDDDSTTGTRTQSQLPTKPFGLPTAGNIGGSGGSGGSDGLNESLLGGEVEAAANANDNGMISPPPPGGAAGAAGGGGMVVEADAQAATATAAGGGGGGTTEPVDDDAYDYDRDSAAAAVSQSETNLTKQMSKLWVTLNPNGPTQGVVLSAVLYVYVYVYV